MARDLPREAPTESDRALSTTQAAEWAGKKRQTIDAAISGGRLVAQRLPNTNRIWIRESDLRDCYTEAPEHAAPRTRQDQQDRPTEPVATDADEVSRLRAEVSDLRAVNALLLAEAADRDEAEAAAAAAFDTQQRAVQQQAQAQTALRASRAKYREALALLNTPHPGDDGT